MTCRVLLAALALLGAGATATAHDLSGAPEAPRNALPPEVLQSVDLGNELPGMEGRSLRLRKVTLEPGGAIPPHSHVDRPAVVYILQGRVREHRSDHDAPIEYGAGDSMTESEALHHWIENIGDEPLIGIVVDIPNEGGAEALSEEEILRRAGRAPHRHD